MGILSSVVFLCMAPAVVYIAANGGGYCSYHYYYTRLQLHTPSLVCPSYILIIAQEYGPTIVCGKVQVSVCLRVESNPLI